MTIPKTEAIYALPDHQVVSDLLPDIGSRRLGVAEARRRIAANPGLVPLAIDPAGAGTVLWGDLGRHPFREWQFLYTVKHLAEQDAIGEHFATGMEILDDEDSFADSVRPSGFIFHISRCGSTLLAKALARPAGNMMISQGGPLQRGFWAHVTDDWRRPATADETTLRRLRAVILAMTRRRCGDERRAFIKFISWNSLYIDLIAAAFPDVPSLFLYRDPVEVIASVRRETTAALLARGTREGAFLTGRPAAETAAMSDVSYLAACYARYFEAALHAEAPLSYIDYRELSAERIAFVAAEGLGYVASDEEIAAMQAQFRFHSKDDAGTSTFRDDSAAKQMALSSKEREEVERLCLGGLKSLGRSPRNLFMKRRAGKTTNPSHAMMGTQL
ncbi:MAG: hypothetical protein D6807_08580 [Alphaproteobacteria bacterium]|nr:MAG: hypothetical protein D6807_08580 [Alphaproteobacteria bacterium]